MYKSSLVSSWPGERDCVLNSKSTFLFPSLFSIRAASFLCSFLAALSRSLVYSINKTYKICANLLFFFGIECEAAHLTKHMNFEQKVKHMHIWCMEILTFKPCMIRAITQHIYSDPVSVYHISCMWFEEQIWWVWVCHKLARIVKQKKMSKKRN